MIGRRVLFSIVMVLVCARTLAAQTQIAVNGAAPSAGVTVIAGAAVSVAIAGGPGNATDWVAFFPAGAPDGAFIDWRYLNGYDSSAHNRHDRCHDRLLRASCARPL